MSGDEDVELEQDRRERLTNLTTVLNLGLKDYRRMRKYISYDPPRISFSAEFYKNEQQLIFKEVYQRFAHAVCPQKPLNFSVLEDKEHTRVAAKICNHLGLSNLIERKCDYNIKLVQQFFATLVIGKEENIPLTWMTGDRRCESDFSRFANLLGYDFISAEDPCGARMHTPGVAPLKAEMTPLYLSDAFTPGKTYGLNRLFNTLLCIFRNNIAPEARNLDDIRGGLVNLLVYANRVLTGIEEGTAAELEPLDVMDFIFNEIKECIEGRKVPVYAPYIMILLINDGGASATAGCVEHKVSYIQKKLTPAERHAAGPIPEGPGPSTRRTRSASAAQGGSSSSQAHASYFPDASAKKPTGWQRLLMCIGKDNRKAMHSQH
ncbi:hypothetical protein ACQ4PT_005302 [Festuca glaucescens]